MNCTKYNVPCTSAFNIQRWTFDIKEVSSIFKMDLVIHLIK
jgi:hypothetical protein